LAHQGAFIRTRASELPASIRPAFIRDPAFIKTLSSSPRRLLQGRHHNFKSGYKYYCERREQQISGLVPSAYYNYILGYNSQGWARDVKARDRDAHLPRPRPPETRPRRDVKISRRDRDETFVALET